MAPVIVIHGGAGAISRQALSADVESQYHQALRDVLQSCSKLLQEGEAASDVVAEAVRQLEDCPLFNAGHGSVLTADASVELDASIMDGQTLRAGAVAGVRHIRNPVLAARAIMNHSQHVFFIGEGAERVARSHGIEMVDPSYFFTPQRLDQLERVRRDSPDAAVLDHGGRAVVKGRQPALAGPLDEGSKMGTVGAVALDRDGRLAAATSTGGITNKQVGRVGDAPVIGAGCYADTRFAAVSCTGTGEMYLRAVAAYDVIARMRYAGKTLAEASREVMFDSLPAIGGMGGLIAIDSLGNIAMPFNTEGMYRGYARAGEPVLTDIY